METKSENNLFTYKDIFAEADKNIPIDPTKRYDPLYFWEDLGDKYLRNFKSQKEMQVNAGWIIFKMRSLKIENVLEVGCSFGRLAPYLLMGEACKEYRGIDFSENQIKVSDIYLGISENKNTDKPIAEEEIKANKEWLENFKSRKEKIKLSICDARNLSFLDGSFDCVLTHEFFTHLPDGDVEKCIKEILRTSKKYFICVERFVYSGEKPAPHLFSHDLTRIFRNFGANILESHFISNGVVGIVGEK